MILGFDTATPATVVAVLTGDDRAAERRHDPAPGERPGHAAALLPLAREALAELGATFADVARIAVGVGPGTFTGLRIGVATARALAQATGTELAAISTLEALAEPLAGEGRAVLAVLDARRGEAFVGAYRDGERLLAPAAMRPEELGALAARSPEELGALAVQPPRRAGSFPEELGALAAQPPRGAGSLPEGQRGAWLAVGDGAIRFRDRLEPAADVPRDAAELHHVSALAVCRLARTAPSVDRDGLLPEYVRAPDAVPRQQ